MDLLQSVALAGGMAWASGLRLYAAVLAAGTLGRLGYLQLPETLRILENPWILGLSAALFVIEFLADKIPAVDSVWDSVQAFIRIPAGAVLAALALGGHDPVWMLAAGILGGTLTAGTQAAKSGSRALINTSPEPFSNGIVSLFEDGLVVGVVWLATQYPVAFGFVLVVMVLLSIVLLVVLFKFLRAVLRRLSGGVRFRRETPA